MQRDCWLAQQREFLGEASRRNPGRRRLWTEKIAAVDGVGLPKLGAELDGTIAVAATAESD